MQATKEKYGRLNIRLRMRSKDAISKAAHILGQDLTEFSESTLTRRAEDVIEKHESFELSQAERSDLFKLLDAPVKAPTRASRKAIKKYKEMVESGKLLV